MDNKALELASLAFEDVLNDSLYYRVADSYTYGVWADNEMAILGGNYAQITNGITRAVIGMANGKVNYALPYLPEEIRSEARRLEGKGILKRCSRGAEVKAPVKFENHFVQTVKWAITGKCNYKCKHCILSAPENKIDELPLSECKRIIREMAECGITSVSLSGGEPLYRKDFIQLVDEFCKHHIRIINIGTNGSLVTNQLLEQLLERGVKPAFYMSFDGVGWHDWLRGMEGAEKQLMSKFELLAKRGFQTGSAITLHKGNAPVLRETINRLVSVGAKTAIVNRMMDFGEWAKYGKNNSMTQRETLEVYLEYLPHFYEDGMPINVTLNRMIKVFAGSYDYKILAIKQKAKCERTKLCGAAYRAVYINGDGKLAPCLYIAGMDGQQENFADLTKMHLRDALEKSRYAACVGATVKDYYDANPECAACEYREYCQGGCRAQALEFDDTNYMGMDRHRCEFFKDQFTERILQRMAETVPQARCVNLPEDYPLKPLD